jgi:hypothetical protein
MWWRARPKHRTVADMLRLEEIRRQDAAFDAAAAVANPSSLLKPGALSAAQISVAGYDGYMFIGNGATRWERQYLGELKVEPQWLEAWSQIFARRQAEAAARNVQLVNFVAPEKQVVYPEKRWPAPLPDGERRPLRQILARLGPEARMVYPDAVLEAAKAPAPAYLRRNSHWTPWGCCAALAPLLSELGVDADLEDLAFAYEVSSIPHDLPAHFFQSPAAEEAGWLKPAGEVFFDNRHLERTGKHAGSQYGIRNPAAPDPRRVLVCGDSYAFDGGLTYALSAVFAEVAFAWSKAVDWDLVAGHDSQIVIWESAERFLATQPTA